MLATGTPLYLYGPPGSGKTTFAANAPGPVGYQGIDFGHEGVIDPFLDRDHLIFSEYMKPSRMKRKGEDNKKYAERLTLDADAVWQDWDSDFQALLTAGARSIVWDTADEIFETLTLALHGRTEKIMPRDRGQLYQLYSSRIREVLNRKDINLLLVHRSKEVWTNDKPTGKFAAKGYSDTNYLAQVELEFSKDTIRKGAGFQTTMYATIRKCRVNRDLEGHVFPDPTFFDVAAFIKPEVDPENWICDC